MRKRYLTHTVQRAVQVFALLLVFGHVRADCLTEQAACFNRCIAVNIRDMACTTRCGQRAEACLEREANQEKLDSEEDRPPNAETDHGSTEPAPVQAPYRPTQAARPSQYDSTDASSCYETFYDPKSYNWLAIRNKCSNPIHVTWKCRSCAERLGSSADIPPGQSVGVGYSREEVERKGGMSYAACREGFRAVNSSGDSWRGESLYGCRKR